MGNTGRRRVDREPWWRPFNRGATSAALPLHRVEELVVGLGFLDLVEKDLDGREFVHRVQQFAQDPDLLQIRRLHQQLFSTSAGAVDIDGGINPLLRDAPVEVQLHVTGALELLVDHIVHARTGFDQRRGDDRQAAALFDVPRRAEKALGPMQRVGVDTAGEHFARGRHDRVVSSRQPRDGVEQDDDIALMLDQALGLLDHHFSDLHVPGGRFVEGAGDHFAAHGACHLGDFLGPLVDEQHDQVALRMVDRDALRNVLQHHRLTGLGRGNDQAALAFADRRRDVDDARRNVFGAPVAALQPQLFASEQRCQVLEQDLALGLLRLFVVDFVDFQQREITLALFRRPYLAGDRVARAQTEATDLAGGDVNVIRAGQVGAVGGAQKAEAVLQYLQHSVAVYVLAGFCAGLEERKDYILFARPRHSLDIEGLRNQIG